MGEKALRYLTLELSKNNVPYYLSASGLHYILDEYVYPYDIDLFVSKENIDKAFLVYLISTKHLIYTNGKIDI